MNLRVYNTKDRLRETIDAMSCAWTKKELDKLFTDAIQELLEYESELRKEMRYDKLNESEEKTILNYVYGIHNMK